MAKNPLSIYGKPVKEYRGEGVLSLRDGRKLSCSFIAGQLSDGDIRLLCSFKAPYSLTLSTNILDQSIFSGITEEGHKIWSKDNIIWIPNNYSTFTFFLNELIIETGNLESATKMSFYIDNFVFYGDNNHHNCLSLTLPELNTVKINRINNYDEVIRDIQINRGIDITCEMVIELSSEQSFRQVEGNCAELCLLLSICRGTRVQWIYYEIINGNDDVIYRAHHDVVTRPYTALSAIIRQDLFGIKDTKKFLEQSYSILCSDQSLRRNVFLLINSYIDAKEHGFMESRGMKNAVVCEIIKSYALSRSDYHIPGNVVLDSEFETIKGKINTIIKQNVSDSELRALFYQNIGGINRTPFKEIIKKTCEKIELPIDDIDLSLLTASRNNLIHEGKFYRESATERERARLPPLVSDFAELQFLQNFLDKLMLRLFGYHGNYINCRDPENFERVDQI